MGRARWGGRASDKDYLSKLEEPARACAVVFSRVCFFFFLAGSTAFKSKGLTDELKGRVIQAIVDELALGTSLSESGRTSRRYIAQCLTTYFFLCVCVFAETDAALVTLRILARERTGLENMQTPKVNVRLPGPVVGV